MKSETRNASVTIILVAALLVSFSRLARSLDVLFIPVVDFALKLFEVLDHALETGRADCLETSLDRHSNIYLIVVDPDVARYC